VAVLGAISLHHLHAPVVAANGKAHPQHGVAGLDLLEDPGTQIDVPRSATNYRGDLLEESVRAHRGRPITFEREARPRATTRARSDARPARARGARASTWPGPTPPRSESRAAPPRPR